MKAIFEEYGGPIITALVLVGLIAVLGVLIGTDGGGIIGVYFSDMVNSLFSSIGIGGGGAGGAGGGGGGE